MLAALALWASEAAPAGANVSDVTVRFCVESQCWTNNPTTSSPVGATPQYRISFKVSQGFAGDEEEIVVEAPPGTRFPPLWDQGTYLIVAPGPHWVLGSVSLEDEGSTARIRPANPGLQIAPGGTMRLDIGSPIPFEGRATRNPTVAGDYTLRVRTTNNAAGESQPYPITPGPARHLRLINGAEQRVLVGERFDPLVVHVSDEYFNGTAELVEFRLPEGPASGTFPNGERTVRVWTAADGVARAPAITATGTRGPWTALASLPSRPGAEPVRIQLRNVLPGADEIELSLDPPALPADGVATARATARVVDGFGRPLPGLELSAAASAGVSVGPVSDLGDGSYRFELRAGTEPGRAEVRVEDPASGVSTTAALELKPDRRRPTVRITKSPPSWVRGPRVRVRFASTARDLARFECKLDRRRWRPCASPVLLRVKPGRHVFRVRAVDRAGNRSKPAVARFRVRR